MSFELRRTRWLGATGSILLGFVAVVALVPAQFVELSPGPTFNTIGEVDGKALIQISGHRTYPTSGHLDMTTVSERGGPYGPMYVARVLQSWFDPHVRVLPTDALYPDDVPAEQIEQESRVDFVDSQGDAVAAALRHLDIPVAEKVVVAAVSSGAPADGKLEVGDLITSVDGAVVTSAKQVGDDVRRRAPGDRVALVVTRDGKQVHVEVVAGAAPDDPSKAFLGISTGTTYVPPFGVDFTLEDVGGPSAGMMFALGIVDKLTPGEINGGRFVAGTGTIGADGKVGPIGGIAQKLAGARGAGATFFLAPASNCDEVTGHVPDGLTVAPVSTLDQAVSALADYTAGRPAPTCPAG